MRPRKFTVVVDSLLSLIAEQGLAAGSPLPSQNTLAAQYEVSRSCVNKALSVLVERGVIESRPGLGTFVRGRESSRRPFRSLAFLIPEEIRTAQNTWDNFGVEILMGVEAQARAYSANCLLRRCTKLELSEIASVAASVRADGIIAHFNLTDQQVESIQQAGVPVVMAGRAVNAGGIGFSAPNITDYFYQMARRILEQGVKRVGLLYAPSYVYGTDAFLAISRLQQERVDSEFQIVDYSIYDEGYSASGTSDDTCVPQAVDNLVKSGCLPEVLFCVSDWIAWRAILALGERGICVPGDIGVVGCLDLGLSLAHRPSISTFAVDAQALGGRAVSILHDIIEDGATPRIERIPLTFVERESFVWSHVSHSTTMPITNETDDSLRDKF